MALGRQFWFTLKLKDCPVNGVYGDLNFKNGVARFTLKDGESKTAKDIPAETEYVVTEDEDTRYETTSNNEQGMIGKDTVIEVSFVNKIKGVGSGRLSITKQVAGEQADQEKNFHFTLTLTDCPLNGTYGDLTFSKGIANFSLKHGETKTAEKIPAGTVYEVTEAPDWKYEVNAQNAKGTIEEDQVVEASFVNTRINLPEVGTLGITKTVVGEQADSAKNFEFILTLSDTSLNGTYGDLTFTNGVAVFLLKNGERVAAKDIPAGTEYIVAEAPDSDYTVISSNAQGTVHKDEAIEVKSPISKSLIMVEAVAVKPHLTIQLSLP